MTPPQKRPSHPELPASYRTHDRQIAARMGWFFVEYLRSVYDRFDGDMVLPIILGEIAHHNVCDYFSSGKPIPGRYPLRDQPTGVPDHLMHPCNAFSLSEATGIPRETVRRKIAELLRRGWVLKHKDGGYVMAPNLSDQFSNNFNADLLRRLLAMADEIKALLASGETETQNRQSQPRP